MSQDIDKNTTTTLDHEFSSITQLTTIDTTLAPYESDNDILNTIIIHPSTTNITYKSEVSCETPPSQSESHYSSQSSSLSISEGHTHSLSPSTHNSCGHPLYVSMSTNKVFDNKTTYDFDDNISMNNLKLEEQQEPPEEYDSIIEQKQHILKPITIPSKSVSDLMIKSKPIPNFIDTNSPYHSDINHSNYMRKHFRKNNHSNTYRKLELQMIHNLQSNPTTPITPKTGKQVPKTLIQKSKSNPQLHNNINTFPTPPIHPLQSVQSQPNLQLSAQYSPPCHIVPQTNYYGQYYPYIDTSIAPVYYCNNNLPSPTQPITPDTPPQYMYQIPMLQHVHSSPMINFNTKNNSNANVSYYAFNHENGNIQKLTPVSIDSINESKTPISSFSYSQQTPTPIYTATTTPSKSTKISDYNSCEIQNIIGKNNGKYWDFAEYHCDEYSLIDFAMTKFQINKHKKTSIFSTNNSKKKVEKYDIKFLRELISFAPFKKMKHSLLIMENREQNKIGIQIWKNINSYMGVRKSSKSDHKHCEKILKVALNSNQKMKDEIFCQIIKQTNVSDYNNEINFYKLVKGWKLMCICCNIFCPSIELSKYLSVYLFNKAKDIEFGDGKISEMSVFALNSLNNCMVNGNRKIEPIPYELTYIENYQLIPIKIYFLDDTFITILINSQMTCKQLCNIIVSKLKIKYFEYFSLYEFEFEEFGTNNNELKQYNNRLDMNYKQKVNNLNNILINREININERIMDVFSSWIRYTNKKNKNIKFVYKCKILNKYKMNKDLFSMNEWKLIYLNEYYNVMHNKYPIATENDLLHLQAIANTTNQNQIHPQLLINKFNNNYKKCKEAIIHIQSKFYKDFTQKQCWIHYIKYLYNINNMKSFIGCIFFYCVGKINNKNKLFVNNDLIIGINYNSLIIINPPTKQIIYKFKLEQIITYGFKSKEFIFVAGTLVKQQKYQFNTNYAKQINATLQQYIEITSNNNQ